MESGCDVSDFDKYLAEPPLRLPNPKDDKFDALSWWKAHKDVYPVLSFLAHDILAMQASTITSESALSLEDVLLIHSVLVLNPASLKHYSVTRIGLLDLKEVLIKGLPPFLTIWRLRRPWLLIDT